MEQKRKAKLSEIREWYRFNLSLDIWTETRFKDKVSYTHKLPEETWYGGYWFNSGYFALIQCKLFTIHIMFKWWCLKF